MDVEKLINTTRETWFSIQKMLNKSKEKTFGTYLKHMTSIIKPILLCIYWGDSLTKKRFILQQSRKISFIYVQTDFRINKNVNNMKALASVGKVPLKINIETQMFK